MVRNIFVPALDDLQRGELETIRDAEDYAFHPLLDYASLIDPEHYDFGGLLERARTELDQFPGSIDAIVAHWDFPTSVLVPILCRDHGFPSPSVESVVTCEHKYWSRVAQREAIPEHVPAFVAFDPFADDPLESIDLSFPFWVKPVKSHSSQLGFRIEDEEQFRSAITQIRDEIGRVGDAFDDVMRLAEVPDRLLEIPATHCLAEQIVSGFQVAPEGTMYQGEFNVHGILDMHTDQTDKSFERLDYPTDVPVAVQKQMIDAVERYMRHVGFDNGCFNAEFLWDEDDQLWLIEVNTRLSQSHADLFAKVDGMSNHEVAVDIALGERPSMPYRQGRYVVATKGIVPWYEDGVVRRVPNQEEIAELQGRFPETKVEIDVAPGDRLADLKNQDEYRYELGVVYLGADSRDELVERYRACVEALHFEFDPVDDA